MKFTPREKYARVNAPIEPVLHNATQSLLGKIYGIEPCLIEPVHPTAGTWADALVRQQVRTAKAQGCECAESSVQEFARAEVSPFSVPVSIDEGFEEEVTALAERYENTFADLKREYSMRRACHQTEEGFYCYCDEHEHLHRVSEPPTK